MQHAKNPIDWYPWGKQALDKAINEDKPIFLSIGYSTCRWCHNMNRDTFQDKDVANILNEYFVPIKVDREERPDLDKVYISFAEALTGTAGWPLTLILTPDKKPFFAGTYFPKESENGRVGLIDILNEIKTIWEENKDRVISESNRILTEVDNIFNYDAKEDLDKDILFKAVKELKENFDEINGGFFTKPKFPLVQNILFLLEYGYKARDDGAIDMACKSLDKMYKGGIFDHVGFGFYRYAVDESWLVPHFEKMLYDNALLAIAYSLAYEKTEKAIYREIVEKIFEFVIRDLASDDGSFYSALDAETEGEEGKYYIFTKEEIIDLLGEEFGEFYCDYYNISEEGNFEGKNILNLIDKDLLSISNRDKAKLEGIRDKVFQYREQRTQPHRDEKILTAWNGLFIAALSYGGRILNNENYINHAKRAADFFIANLIDEDGHLLSVSIDGVSYNYGFLEDYAFFIFGLLNLYRASEHKEYLKIALKLNEDMMNLFLDKKYGGLYYYSNLSEELILRPKDIYDGALPSGNSIALLNLALFYNITGKEEFKEGFNDLIGFFAHRINISPMVHLYSILALMILEK